MQPKERYPELLPASDACLVTLRAEVKTPAVPSKMAMIMAAGRPIIASLPPGDAWKVVQESKSGTIVKADDALGLANAIRAMKLSPSMMKTYGENGRAFATEYLYRSSCVKRVESILHSAVAEAKSK